MAAPGISDSGRQEEGLDRDELGRHTLHPREKAFTLLKPVITAQDCGPSCFVIIHIFKRSQKCKILKNHPILKCQLIQNFFQNMVGGNSV